VEAESTYSNIGWINGRCLLFVDEFIASEESHGIWVVLEGFDHTKDMGKIINVVCTGRVIAVNGHKWSIHIKYHIDTSCVEDTCTIVVVDVGIDVIHADGIDLSKVLAQLPGSRERYKIRRAFAAMQHRVSKLLHHSGHLNWIQGQSQTILPVGNWHLLATLVFLKFSSMSPYSTPMIITLFFVTESTNSWP
jgi:hypothetical protein